ncbi:MAG TPA: site-specific integrase [Clostridia bacterium]|nr:site-specific integrase [Clostridia bacterium]
MPVKSKDSAEAKRTYETGSITNLGDGKYLLRASAGKKLGGQRARPQKTIHAKNDNDAERQMRAFLAEIKARSSKENMTVSGLIDAFTESHLPTLAKTTQWWYEDTLRRVRGGLGYLKLTEIKPLNIRSFYAALADPNHKTFCKYTLVKKNGTKVEKELKNGLRGEYILHHHRALSSVLNWGYENEYMDVKIMDRITAPESDSEKKRALNPSEIRAFLLAIEKKPLKWRLFFFLALTTGMRREEMVALEWPYIYVLSHQIKICQAAYVDKQGKNAIGKTKNRASNRIIEAGEQLFEMFRSWRTEQLAERMAWPEAWDTSHQFVFTEPHGGPIMLDNCTAMARRLFDSIGIYDVSLHNLRHTSITRQLASGIPVANVAAYHGHASIKMTLDTYADTAEEYKVMCAAAGETILITNMAPKTPNKHPI